MFRPKIQPFDAKKLQRQQEPKGFQREVERVRKQREQQEKMKLEEEKRRKGENYAKQRLTKAKPPSFLSKSSSKRALLLSLDVQLAPNRTGRVGIKEGDDPELVAKNFCKTYRLSRKIQENLTAQFVMHMESYYEHVQQRAHQSH